MSITFEDAKNALRSSGFSEVSSTAKLVEFESKDGCLLYLYEHQGFPDHADLIVHPEANVAALLSIPEVEANRRVTNRFGSNMSRFPTRINKGAKPEHYGRTLYVYTQAALLALCKGYKS